MKVCVRWVSSVSYTHLISLNVFQNILMVVVGCRIADVELSEMFTVHICQSCVNLFQEVKHNHEDILENIETYKMCIRDRSFLVQS